MKPKVAIFDFASCEGCELQIANLEEDILEIVERVDIVSFREVMKEHSDVYDIAFVEGSVNRPIDAERLKDIRSRAKILVAMGDCACTGCVNKLRNDWSVDNVKKEVYADAVKQMKNNEFFEIFPTKALNEVVKVDFYIRGCPIRKEQFLYYVRRLSWMPLHPLRDMKFTVTPREGQEDSRSLVRFQPSKCILCRRCDVICCETLGVDALGLIGKGPETAISTPRNIGFDANGCIACGQCIAVCSCGALDTKSQVPDLLSALSSGKKMCAALDSSVLPSLAERDPYLYSMDPAEFESLVIGSLLSAGFAKVIPYDRYIMES
ncbi:MAG: hypothetical protein PHU53_06075, partial [Thermoplasmata archaeon]|nr:hypothetical protein [Thermoplasmata archaeon]